MIDNQLNLKVFFKQQKELEKKAQQHIRYYTHKSIVNQMNAQQKNTTKHILYGI